MSNASNTELTETLESYKAQVAKTSKRNAVWTAIGITFLATLVVGTIFGYFLSINVINNGISQGIEVVSSVKNLK